VHIGTWNVNGQASNGEPLQPWLIHDDGTTKPKKKKINTPTCIFSIGSTPDIYAIGFQELVPLSAKQLMVTDPAKLVYWEALITRTLNAKRTAEYVLLRSEQLVGAAMYVFVNKNLLDIITNVEANQCKTGLAGIAGNKGGVAVRFELGATTICFICAHLAAGTPTFVPSFFYLFICNVLETKGQPNVEDRNRDYNTITEGIQFPMAGSVDKHDVVFWFGDFNYRIDLPNEDVRRRCAQGAANGIKGMLPYDQVRAISTLRMHFSYCCAVAFAIQGTRTRLHHVQRGRAHVPADVQV